MGQRARRIGSSSALVRRLLTACMASTALFGAVHDARANAVALNMPINFYGTPGLFDMPGGHMMPDGTVTLGVMESGIQSRVNFAFQALPWFEGSFRYIATEGLLGEKPYYDRSFGVKIRLQDEIDGWPDISVGAMDVIGTSFVAGEYLVASKHLGPLDFTLGLGWGRLASTGMFKNPFAYVISAFGTRSVVSGLSGTGQVQFGQLFRGPDTSLFGGAIWQTPIDGLSLLGEYSSDDYRFESRHGVNFHPRTQFNAGASYQYSDWLQISGAWMYGTQAMFQVTFAMQPKNPLLSPRFGEPPLPPQIRSEATLEALNSKERFGDGPVILSTDSQGTNMMVIARGSMTADCGRFGDALRSARKGGFQQIAILDIDDPQGRVRFCPVQSDSRTAALQLAPFLGPDDGAAQEDSAPLAAARRRMVELGRAQGIEIDAIAFNDTQADVAFTNSHYRTETEAYGRLARVLMASVPDDIETFRLISMEGGMPVQELVLSRGALERTMLAGGGGTEILPSSSLMPPQTPGLLADSLIEYPRFDWSVLPEYNQSLFDPDEPYRFQILAAVKGGVEFVRGLRLDTELQADIVDTFKNLRGSNSLLPRVRSNFNKYFQKGKNGIARLQTSYEATVAPEFFAEFRAGYLESMFAGAGGEVLWRPEGKRLAIGIEAYEVWQRGFDRLFDLQRYHVFTGHISLYYQLPYYGLNVRVHAGRYLAGDYGATFELTRQFDTGVEIGAFATFTNVPFAKFGEGSFDKGITISIPIDWMVPVNGQSSFDMNLRPLTRDGGQMLIGEQSLYDDTRRTEYGQVVRDFNEVVSP